jgi:mannose-1-phosphate guanylyltransferase
LIRALLLAAGVGSRLRPITDSIPKCLVDINGRPLLDYWLELLTSSEVKNILINLHYLPAMVEEFVLKSKYALNTKLVLENRLLGTGGTILKNRIFFGQDPVMLIHADNLSIFSVNSFIKTFNLRDKNTDITMMTFNTDMPEECGIVELNKDGKVINFYEKIENPPSNLANAAVYILSPTVIDFIASLDKQFIDFSTEVLPHFLGRINTFHNEIYHRDIGTQKSLSLARNEYPLALSKLN